MAKATDKILFGYPYKQSADSYYLYAQGVCAPNVIYRINKSQLFVDAQFSVNPIAYINDQQITEAMHLEFGGIPSFIIGTFRTNRNTRYFDITDPLEAEHLLIRVAWGGQDAPGKYGCSQRYVDSLKYVIDFTRPRSNCRMGYDYWIVPVGFYVGSSASPCKFKTRGQKYCQRFSDERRQAIQEAKAAARLRQLNEEASRQNRDSLLPRLKFLKERLEELSRYTKRYVETIDLKDKTYYKVGYKSFLYSKENVDETEKWFCGVEDRILEELMKK